MSLNHSWIFAVADDLTGALETGAMFADHGLDACVTTQHQIDHRPERTVHIIDSETRHCTAAEAAARVALIATHAAHFSPGIIYKKTDSTLRGNISSELQGLSQAFPGHRIIYAPAYPAMRRTVRNGHLLVNGKPVHETEFGSDRLNPVTDSNVHKLLNGLGGQVLDGETDADIFRAAQMVLSANSPVIAVGPAALAGALALQCGQSKIPLPKHNVRRCLVVNGSLHPASRIQLDWAKQHGVFDNDWRCFDQPVEGEGMERARQTGVRVHELWKSGAFDGLIVFGGDTALGIHRAFGASPFIPAGELLPGVPLSTVEGVTWLTKAGGFGSPEILSEMKRLLT